MPRYFFHLRFGDRVLHDDEGVELPSRSAAHDEAQAVIRDLAGRSIGLDSRRWAGWFLQVTDDQDQFLRCPIGHPALDLVPPGGAPLSVIELPPAPARDRAADVQAADDRTHAARDVVSRLLARLGQTARLLERHRQLRLELSDRITASQGLCARTRLLVARAKLASSM
jgi:hypothetical protein